MVGGMRVVLGGDRGIGLGSWRSIRPIMAALVANLVRLNLSVVLLGVTALVVGRLALGLTVPPRVAEPSLPGDLLLRRRLAR